MSIFFGGATQIRTGGRGVADLCLTTWPWRHIYLTDELYHKISEMSRGFTSLFVKVWLLVILERLRLARSVCHFGGKQTNFLDGSRHHLLCKDEKFALNSLRLYITGLETQCCAQHCTKLCLSAYASTSQARTQTCPLQTFGLRAFFTPRKSVR